jgi:hypothetical protein
VTVRATVVATGAVALMGAAMARGGAQMVNRTGPPPAAAARAPDPPSRRPATGSIAYTLLADSSDDIKAAIDQTVSPMNFIVRPIARGRLNRTNPTPRRVRVDLWPDSIGVAFDDGNAIVTPYTGQPGPWQNSLTHETYQAYMKVEGDTICQMISAPDGERENAFVFANDGKRLRMHVTVTSRRLPKPLEYTLAFRQSAMR